MKVALLSYEYPPVTGFGGIGTYAYYQSRALARLGHDVRVIAGSLTPGVQHSEIDGVKITRCSDDGPYKGFVEGLIGDGHGWAPNRVRTAASAYRAMTALDDVDEYDIIEIPECGGDGMIVSTMIPQRYCIRFHSPAPLIMESYGASEREVEATTMLEQIAVGRADVRVASSQFLADEVVEKLAVPAPVHVIGNGIDLDLYDVDEGIDPVDRFGLPDPDEAVTVLFTSRLERRKGVHLLPDIVATTLERFPRAHFVVCGSDRSGWMEREIRPRAEAAGHGDRLHYLGQRTLREIRALVKHVDIHLLPTLWDNAPYACIEAMASGRAILTSDFGGMPELIDHERNGLLARTDDADSFIEELGRFIADADMRTTLGAAVRRTVEESFTDTHLAQRTVDLWQATIDGEAVA